MARGMWVGMRMDMWTKVSNHTDFDAEVCTDKWFERCGEQLWHMRYGILVMAYQLWHISCGKLVVAYQLWHISYGQTSGLKSYGLYRYGLYSYGLYRYGLYSYGLYSYGQYSYGLKTVETGASACSMCRARSMGSESYTDSIPDIVLTLC